MDLLTALSGVAKWRDRIYQADLWNDPNGLSEAMSKLALYNAYITDSIAPLHKTASETEILAFKQSRQSGATAKDAELEGKLKALDARQDYENCKLVSKATSDLVSVIQSRLKILGRNDV